MFSCVAIVGVGLLGGSLARDLKRLNLADEVIGVCRSQSTRDYALEHGIIDRELALAEACAQAELIVLATPMQTLVAQLAEIAELISDLPDLESKIFTDVGSVKAVLAQELSQHPALAEQFVLAHPIAGGERAGVTAAKEQLFSNKHVILIDHANAAAFARVEQLWQSLGAKTVSMDVQTHDSVFAKTSHLPHAVAFALVNALASDDDSAQLFEMAAAGFYDFTRIASSDALMWRDIFCSNQQQVVGAIEQFQQQLQQLKQLIVDDEQQALVENLQQAKSARDLGIKNKQ